MALAWQLNQLRGDGKRSCGVGFQQSPFDVPTERNVQQQSILAGLLEASEPNGLQRVLLVDRAMVPWDGLVPTA